MSRRWPPGIRKAWWDCSTRVFGPDHPATRAKFGRYVGSLRGVLSAVGSGPEAWVACYRELGHAGFRNRSWRRHQRSATPQPHLTQPDSA